ncbi:hypothetical protein M123_4241 [Bacteroides fragilis str. 3976T8]|uniref:Uncharacterized protein n=1 Tax=Bacteroides fragilis str. 3976T8 TaxID=1339314 RepID=A0A016AQQ6_BACFG|nr:hypothetical protein M123_4241 [Bacteroides fragilis str. 3976T8]
MVFYHTGPSQLAQPSYRQSLFLPAACPIRNAGKRGQKQPAPSSA